MKMDTLELFAFWLMSIIFYSSSCIVAFILPRHKSVLTGTSSPISTSAASNGPHYKKPTVFSTIMVKSTLGEESTRIEIDDDGMKQGKEQQLIQSLLQQIDIAGTDGTKASEEIRKSIIDIVDTIEEMKINREKDMTSIPLNGEHDLLYTDTPNTPQYIGPFKGKTTQNFIDEIFFQNVLSLGPVSFAISADRQVMDGSRIKLFFKGLTISLFGKSVVQKELDAKGVWKFIYYGEVERSSRKEAKDLRKKILLRVMKTPNLYILAKDL